MHRGTDRRLVGLALLPLVLLLVAGLMANTGIGQAKEAKAATSAVTVTATVASVVSVSIGCTNAIGFNVVMGSIASGSCVITFGASNASLVPMTVADTDGVAPFMDTPVNFNDAPAACGAMSGADLAGFKVDTTVAPTNATVQACSDASSATNTAYRSVPASATTVCTTAAVGNGSCTARVGVFEFGSNATAGNYVGDMTFTV